MIFQFVLRCLLVARKKNLTGVSTGLTGGWKNLHPTGRSTRLVSIPASLDLLKSMLKHLSYLIHVKKIVVKLHPPNVQKREKLR